MARIRTVTLTIPLGGTDSGALSAQWIVNEVKDAASGLLDATTWGPAALTGTVTIQTRPVFGTGDWCTLQHDGTSYGIGATLTQSVRLGSFGDLRIHSGSAEAAARAVVFAFQVSDE